MSATVKMHDLIFEFDGPEDWQVYFDRETGTIHSFDEDLMARAEDAEGSDQEDNEFETDHDWDEESKGLARLVARDWESKRFVPLPTKFDWHEYRRMEEFIDEMERGDKQDQLNYAIRGKGAFRRFKDAAHRLHVIDEWYAYREKSLVRFLAGWAKDHGITITDEPTTGAD